MYIPVLGVHPDFQGRGYGKKIVDHLIAEAALYHRIPCDISDKFFLDVYTANRATIRLYESKGFIVLNPDTPIVDASENNETYVIMARSVASVGI